MGGKGEEIPLFLKDFGRLVVEGNQTVLQKNWSCFRNIYFSAGIFESQSSY